MSRKKRRARPRLNNGRRGGERRDPATVAFRVPWRFANGGLPRAGEVVRLRRRDTVNPPFSPLDGTEESFTRADVMCVGLTLDGEECVLPHGAAGVLMRGVLLAEDTGHATWELEFDPSDVVQS
jgi:hypothetical protein